MSLLVDLQPVGGIQDYLLVSLADRQHAHNADPADGRPTRWPAAAPLNLVARRNSLVSV
jgi:hypothetical protein